MTTGPATAEPARAGLARRLAAVAYESLLLAALALLVGFALLPLGGSAGTGYPPPLPLPPARGVSFAAVFAACAAYCAWHWTGGRRSLPMKTWRLALCTAAGAPPSIARALLRYVAWWTGPACAAAAYLALQPSGHGRWAVALLGLNYAWVLFDPDRSFLHDRLAGTRIVDTAA